MSVMFSKPLTGYWKNFLLIYRTEELSLAIHQGGEPTAEERARRYHESALSDANRQISILMALVETNESLPTGTTTTGNSFILNTEERDILADSFIADTSSVLFERAREEAVDHYDPLHASTISINDCSQD